jgi:pyruvate formate lyase activating enzyme
VRENRDGTLYTLVYDHVAAIEVDPIEKKPLFHFQPGSTSLSVATVGCNLHCQYCQNHYLSQMPKGRNPRIIGEPITPEEIVETALTHRCRSIAYTYTEPTIFFELVYDTARLAYTRGLKNLLVTNGYMSPTMIRQLSPYVYGANVDLKGFDDQSYRRVCGAKLRPVLESIQFMHALGMWVEVTTMIVPGHNDSDEELQAIAEYLVSLSYNIPWHVTAFFPAYKMDDRAPTPVETVQRAYTIGRNAGLRYVYCGNIPGGTCNSTFCHKCRRRLIERSGLMVLANWIVNDKCPDCDTPIEGVEMSGNPPYKQFVDRMTRQRLATT